MIITISTMLAQASLCGINIPADQCHCIEDIAAWLFDSTAYDKMNDALLCMADAVTEHAYH